MGGIEASQESRKFQFTLPCRERPRLKLILAFAQRFQFTLPCRERPVFSSAGSRMFMFQFTLPCRERPGGLGVLVALRGGFNSRSRVGSDLRRAHMVHE